MSFGRNLLNCIKPILKLQNISVSVKKNVAYLDLVLDLKFKCLDHLTYVKSKTSNLMLSFKIFKFFNHGISSDILKIWYKMVVFKQITYSYKVWFRDVNCHVADW